MPETYTNTHVNTVVIGGGQAGLSVGYHLSRQRVPFVILDAAHASATRGAAGGIRFDCSRLRGRPRSTACRFPRRRFHFRRRTRWRTISKRTPGSFRCPCDRACGSIVCRASATGSSSSPATNASKPTTSSSPWAITSGRALRHSPPICARTSCSCIRSSTVTLAQLRPGDVLLVGAGNSGAEIAVETVKRHRTWLAGRETGHLPFRMDGLAARLVLSRLVLRVIFHRVLFDRHADRTQAAAEDAAPGGAADSNQAEDLAAAGVGRLPRVVGVRDGLPLLEDGRVLDVANVVWCTGFDPGFSWIDLPVFGPDGLTAARRRASWPAEPGLYFVGLPFLYAFSSEMIHGVGRDAARIADAIAGVTAERSARTPRTAERQVPGALSGQLESSRPARTARSSAA